MEEGIGRVIALFNIAIDLAIMATFVGVGMIGIMPGAQKRWSYFAAMVVMGTAFGIVARVLPWIPEGLETVGVILGVIVGPATAARWQGKTLSEAIEDIRSMRRGGDRDG